MEKIPDLRERPTDFELIKNAEEQWFLVDLMGQQIPVPDVQLAQTIKTLLVTQMYSDSISVEAVPGRSVPKFYDTPVTTAVWPDTFDERERSHRSVKQVSEDNCHQTANRLLPEMAAREFSVAFVEISSEEEIAAFIRNSSMPALVQFGWETYGSEDKVHSFVALTVADDRVVCFQKMGYGLPYELVGLDKVYEYWSKAAQHEDKVLLAKVIPKS